jgi:5'-3' exonuclease
VATAASLGAWETAYCEAIVAYLREIVDVAAPTAGVYVSCDGVVCAAKRRQQRLRRFKGPWFSAAERAVKRAVGATAEEVAGSGWNQNALTPGSEFMAKLGTALVAAGRRLATERGLDVRVSTTDEPGEGEHKLLAHMRGLGSGGGVSSCSIYGLDADLILLAMLLDVDTGMEVTLLREAREFEGGASGWRSLYVRELMTALFGAGRRPERVRDFVAAMSLLGNDFLPRSLTRTVRDDGIPTLIGGLERELWSEGRHLVAVADGRSGIRREGLAALIRGWAATEEVDMMAAAKHAMAAARRHVGVGATPVETAMREWQAQPARWCSMGRLSGAGSGWKDLVRGPFGAGPVEDYLAGLAWVWDYYSGNAVCQGWVYDHHLPPLWSDIAAALDTRSELRVAAPPILWPTALPPSIHLLSVLPADSVEELLPPTVARRMGAAPWYWPTSWSLYDVGRGQLWECEPVIPLIPESLLRSWCSE